MTPGIESGLVLAVIHTTKDVEKKEKGSLRFQTRRADFA